MPSQKRKFGDQGEEIAKQHLKSKGYEILGSNYQKPWGEIDIIARKNRVVTFVEVKTRDLSNVTEFLPEYSVNRLKIRKLQKICNTYLSEKNLPDDQEWRIDVIGIAIDKSTGKYNINHIENAVFDS